MAIDPQKLLKAREAIDKYLSTIESQEKERYKKLAFSFRESQSRLSNIESKLTHDKSFDKIMAALAILQKELGSTIQASQPRMDVVVAAINGLSEVLARQTSANDTSPVIKALKQLEKAVEKINVTVDNSEIAKAIKAMKVDVPEIKFPDYVNVGNWPPQRVPQPVTSININPLRGFIKTTAATVTTTLTTLPSYGVLDNRRAILIYNNSSNTIYVGGSDVTATNGMPVPASSYSPILDAGIKMIIYGIASTGSNNVRVMEASNDAIGG